MGFFTRKNEAIKACVETRSQSQIMNEMFDDMEKFTTKMIGQALAYSNGTTFAEMGEDEVRMINDCVDYWKSLRELAMTSVLRSEADYKFLVDQNSKLNKELLEQRKMLEEIKKMLHGVKKEI